MTLTAKSKVQGALITEIQPYSSLSVSKEMLCKGPFAGMCNNIVPPPLRFFLRWKKFTKKKRFFFFFFYIEVATPGELEKRGLSCYRDREVVRNRVSVLFLSDIWTVLPITDAGKNLRMLEYGPNFT